MDDEIFKQHSNSYCRIYSIFFKLFIEMRRTVVAIIFILSVAVNAYADIKWIPIEPIKFNESSKSAHIDINKSKPQPVNRTIENLQVIRKLLDNVDRVNLKTESKKNWYDLDDSDSENN